MVLENRDQPLLVGISWIMLQSQKTLEFQWLQATEVDLLLTLQRLPRSAVALPSRIRLIGQPVSWNITVLITEEKVNT